VLYSVLSIRILYCNSGRYVEVRLLVEARLGLPLEARLCMHNGTSWLYGKRDGGGSVAEYLLIQSEACRYLPRILIRDRRPPFISFISWPLAARHLCSVLYGTYVFGLLYCMYVYSFFSEGEERGIDSSKQVYCCR
jgi:hypothetical protein